MKNRNFRRGKRERKGLILIYFSGEKREKKGQIGTGDCAYGILKEWILIEEFLGKKKTNNWLEFTNKDRQEGQGVLGLSTLEQSRPVGLSRNFGSKFKKLSD